MKISHFQLFKKISMIFYGGIFANSTPVSGSYYSKIGEVEQKRFVKKVFSSKISKKK